MRDHFFLDELYHSNYFENPLISYANLYLIPKRHISMATRTIGRISCEIGDRLYHEKKMVREARGDPDLRWRA